MPTRDLFASLRSSLTIAAAAAVLGAGGCAATAARLNNACNALLIRAQEKHDLADVRQDTREALARQRQDALRQQAQRDVEQARLDAERRQLEAEFCAAHQEALRRQVKRGIHEAVESKVVFNVEHALEVGEIEVDTEALQRLMQQREQEAQQRPPPIPPKQPCPCCDQPCHCGSGLLRRLCPHCRHKPCEAELKCGGPEALARLEQEAMRRPLRPAEIPLKLPVRLSFGMEQPQMEAARIRRVPMLPPEAQRRPCDQYGYPCTDPVQTCPSGHCPLPYPPRTAAGLPPYDAPPAGAAPAEEPPSPPKPAPDTETRLWPPGIGVAPPIRLGQMMYPAPYIANRPLPIGASYPAAERAP